MEYDDITIFFREKSEDSRENIKNIHRFLKLLFEKGH